MSKAIPAVLAPLAELYERDPMRFAKLLENFVDAKQSQLDEECFPQSGVEARLFFQTAAGIVAQVKGPEAPKLIELWCAVGWECMDKKERLKHFKKAYALRQKLPATEDAGGYSLEDVAESYAAELAQQNKHSEAAELAIHATQAAFDADTCPSCGLLKIAEESFKKLGRDPAPLRVLHRKWCASHLAEHPGEPLPEWASELLAVEGGAA
jgi:hypothetical protein